MRIHSLQRVSQLNLISQAIPTLPLYRCRQPAEVLDGRRISQQSPLVLVSHSNTSHFLAFLLTISYYTTKAKYPFCMEKEHGNTVFWSLHIKHGTVDAIGAVEPFRRHLDLIQPVDMWTASETRPTCNGHTELGDVMTAQHDTKGLEN